MSPNNRLTRPPSGRPPSPGRSSQTPAAATAAAPTPQAPKLPSEFTLVVGVRGEDDYECVYVGKVSAKGSEPTPTPVRENVPSHQELVKWFDPEKWKSSENTKSE